MGHAVLVSIHLQDVRRGRIREGRIWTYYVTIERAELSRDDLYEVLKHVLCFCCLRGSMTGES